jgi:hypothetical protein
MRNNGALTVPEKLILAALEIQARGKQAFTAEDLVVEAWRQFPDTFGLSGHVDEQGTAQFPDSNRVYAEVMGSKPVRALGWLVKVGSKMYQLTESGRQHAEHLKTRVGGHQPTKALLSREAERELRKLFSSKAVEKYAQAQEDAITFSDACSFWGISPRSSAIEFRGRAAHVKALVENACGVVGNRSVSFEHGGLPFGSSDLQRLKEVEEFLRCRFDEEIQIILQRKDQRQG